MNVAGNLTREVTPTGEKTVQTFDALGRVTQRTEYAANQSVTRASLPTAMTPTAM